MSRDGRGSRQALFATLCGAALLLSGCAVSRMRTDFNGFEGVYAETSNREVLLNLARLENHDPTYFFKVGQISTSYRMQAALSGNVAYVPQGTKVGDRTVTGSGTPGLIYERNPAFTFIPVNDDTNARLLLQPIPAETFAILYQQGWRIDQLFRLMVDRIEFTGKGGAVETIRNQPPSATGDLDSRELYDYVRFLRVSASVYELQKRGYLLLRGEKHFVPFDHNSPAEHAPEPKDILDATSKNFVWAQEDGKWFLGQKQLTPLFRLNPPFSVEQGKPLLDCEAMKQQVLHDMPQLGVGGEGGETALDQVLSILSNGFSISESLTPNAPGEEQPPVPCQFPSHRGPDGAPHVSVHLVMRSLIGMLAAAAQEQTPFERLQSLNPLVPSRTGERELHFTEQVPLAEQIPLLRLTWKPNDPTNTPPLIQVDYRNKKYLVADTATPTPSGPPENLYWNRDAFRLICQLTAQVTVDISKFPLPEVLQLRTE